MDPRLKHITPREFWGSGQFDITSSSVPVISIDNREVIHVVGNRLALFDFGDKKSTLLPLAANDVTKVLLLCLSDDKRYLAASVQLADTQEATMLVYDMGSHSAGSFQKPRVISNPSATHFTCVCFSNDSHTLACSTDVVSEGILIYDRVRETITKSVSIQKAVTQMSFNPDDDTKLCTTGPSNMFQFWRFSKTVHGAPISGLPKGDHDFTCHTWMTEGRLVAGTNTGLVVLAQGCDALGHHYAFGCPGQQGRVESPILALQTRGVYVVAASVSNVISVFEMKKVNSHTGQLITMTLSPLAKVRLADIQNISGIQWSLYNNQGSFELLVTTPSSMNLVELKMSDYLVTSDEGGSSSRAVVPNGRPKGSTSMALPSIENDWRDTHTSTVLDFHSSEITSLAISSRTSTFVTSSYNDGSTKVWDFSQSAVPALLVDDFFPERLEELPYRVDVHPSGLFVAFACEEDVREYAITDSRLELVRRLPTKVPFISPNGTPFANNQSVSLVKYSNGGHLLAICCGKLAQVFHLYDLDYSAADMNGVFRRVMVISDHSSQITDLTFSPDDSAIFTGSADGAVYRHTLFSLQRDGEFIYKGVSVMRVLCSKLGSVVACFGSDTPHNNNNNNNRSTVSKKASSSSSSSSAAMGGGVGLNAQSLKRSQTRFGNGSQSESATPACNGLTAPSSILASSMELLSRYTTVGAAASNPSEMGDTAYHTKGKHFLVVGDACNISPTSRVIYLESSVTDIALGVTEGVNRDTCSDICVIGLQDGRVLIAMLPFATVLRAVGANDILMQISENYTNNNNPNSNINYGNTTAAAAGAGGGGPLKTHRSAATVGGGGGAHGALIDPSAMPKATARSAAGAAAASRASGALLTNRAASSVTPRVVAGGGGGGVGVGGVSSAAMMLRRASSALGDVDGSGGNNESTHGGGGGDAGQNNDPYDGIPEVEEEGEDDDVVAVVQNTVDVLNESVCRVFRLHAAAVTRCAISATGYWIFTAGADGSIFMLATSSRARDFVNVPERLGALENGLVVTDKKLLESLRGRILEVDNLLEEKHTENERAVMRITEQTNSAVNDLETRLKREVGKRDDIIIRGREEHAKHSRQLQEETDRQKAFYEDRISELEVAYERKLAQESMYLEKMKQAYDEFVVHARLDLKDSRVEAEQREGRVEHKKQQALQEAEKQKAALLMYVEFVNARHEEVMKSLEEAQDKEREKFRLQLEDAAAEKAAVQRIARDEMTQANKLVRLATKEVADKEDEVLRLKGDLDWATGRVETLEETLLQATTELKKRTDLQDKWEFKAGDQQQQLYDMERIRKALTAQLHGLREEIGPKEEKLMRVMERLQELDREYGNTLKAVSDKEIELDRKGSQLLMLQKQVRELRQSSQQKDAALRRAAKFLEEYKVTLSEANATNGNSRAGALASSTVVAATAASRLIEKIYGNNSSSSAAGAPSTAQGTRSTLGTAQKPPSAVQAPGTAGGKNSSNTMTMMVGPGTGTSGTMVRNKSSVGKLAAYADTRDDLADVADSLQRLQDVLKPYLRDEAVDTVVDPEEQEAHRERERQMNMLHRNVSGLKTNLEKVQGVAANKIKNYLTDNEHLLQEVNNIRYELRQVSLENHRLKTLISESNQWGQENDGSSSLPGMQAHLAEGSSLESLDDDRRSSGSRNRSRSRGGSPLSPSLHRNNISPLNVNSARAVSSSRPRRHDAAAADDDNNDNMPPALPYLLPPPTDGLPPTLSSSLGALKVATVRSKAQTAGKELVKAKMRQKGVGKASAPARSQSLSTGLGLPQGGGGLSQGGGGSALSLDMMDSQLSAPISMGSLDRSIGLSLGTAGAVGLTADQKISALMDMNSEVIKRGGGGGGSMMTDHSSSSVVLSSSPAAAGGNSGGNGNGISRTTPGISSSAQDILSHYQTQQWSAATAAAGGAGGVNAEGSLASSSASLKAHVNAPRIAVPAKLGRAKLTLPAMEGGGSRK